MNPQEFLNRLKFTGIIFLIAGLVYLLSGCSGDDPQKPFIRQGGGLTDIEGNQYKTAIIGNQEWMVGNLKTTKLNDGSSLSGISNLDIWFSNFSPAYCFYDNDISKKDTYGVLYNWYAVKTNKLCPTGWKVPDNSDWDRLIQSLDGTEKAGEKMKEEGTAHWSSPNTATNSSGISALPGGYNYPSPKGFGNITKNGFWWSYTEFNPERAYALMLSHSSSGITKTTDYIKTQGLSCTCVKN